MPGVVARRSRDRGVVPEQSSRRLRRLPPLHKGDIFGLNLPCVRLRVAPPPLKAPLRGGCAADPGVVGFAEQSSEGLLRDFLRKFSH